MKRTMSVVKSKRSSSSMEFINNAEELELYTYRHTGRFPKRYYHTLTRDIITHANLICNYVTVANEFPVTVEDYDDRINKFYKAKSEIQQLVRQVRIADELFGIKSTVLEEWMCLADKQDRLLGGIIYSDKQMSKMIKNGIVKGSDL